MIVIIVNKTSNIVEDLETLRLFTKVLNEYCPGEVDEANVCKNAFELVFAFDEIIALGHKENVTLRDIQASRVALQSRPCCTRPTRLLARCPPVVSRPRRPSLIDPHCASAAAAALPLLPSTANASHPRRARAAPAPRPRPNSIHAGTWQPSSSTSRAQVNIEMESHEEKLATMIRQSKEREAQDEMKRKVREMKTLNKGKGGIGGGGLGSVRDFAEDVARGNISMPGVESGGGSSMGAGGSASWSSPSPAAPTLAKPKKGTGGMQLGAKKGVATASSLLQDMVNEGEVQAKEVGVTSPTSTSAGGMQQSMQQQPITLLCEEKLAVSLKRDGGVNSMEVNGSLQLTVNDGNFGKAIVPLKLGKNPGFQFKTHPKISKQLFADSAALGLTDPSKPFPVSQLLNVVKWRLQTTDDALVPLAITCWPSETGGDSFEVTLEYEMTQELELHDVIISIPIPADVQHQVTSAEVGQASYSRREAALQWSIPMIESGSGTIEFQVTGATPDAIFPIAVSFTSRKTVRPLPSVFDPPPSPRAPPSGARAGQARPLRALASPLPR